jgi:hypothetical protein
MFFVKFLEFASCNGGLDHPTMTVPTLVRAFVGPNRLAANIMRYCRYSIEDVRKMVSYVKEMK